VPVEIKGACLHGGEAKPEGRAWQKLESVISDETHEFGIYNSHTFTYLLYYVLCISNIIFILYITIIIILYLSIIILYLEYLYNILFHFKNSTFEETEMLLKL
jgi:hypothetical protein